MRCGIEEAGRGPVIGPLVMVGVMGDLEDEKTLKALGVKDSKLLSPKRREELYPKILEIIKKYKVIILSPHDIDEALASDSMNLNFLEGKTSADIINELKPEIAILDCPSTNLPAYHDYVKARLTHDAKIIAEHKADLNYTIVSAASIIAKVLRDRAIKEIETTHKIVVGSGYPSDKKTQVFLKENYKKYDFFRKSWSSYKRLSQPTLAQFTCK
ncbi:MAG: ribonuclease HII [Candidatus Woesearchaeota archaeon]